MKIKICGLKSFEDIEYVNNAEVDYAGFIFADKSKRKISVETAFRLKKALSPRIKSVGVFVDETPEKIKEICDKGIIDLIQLHGNEDNEYITRLKKITDKEIIKAYKADENLKAETENSKADYILIDSFDKDSFGGTGKTVDLKSVPKTDKKVFIAGGINADNVCGIIKMLEPYGVDINSGVETDGRKDGKKISEIVGIIRNFEDKK